MLSAKGGECERPCVRIQVTRSPAGAILLPGEYRLQDGDEPVRFAGAPDAVSSRVTVQTSRCASFGPPVRRRDSRGLDARSRRGWLPPLRACRPLNELELRHSTHTPGPHDSAGDASSLTGAIAVTRRATGKKLRGESTPQSAGRRACRPTGHEGGGRASVASGRPGPSQSTAYWFTHFARRMS